MSFFKFFTPISYWLLIVLWSFIFFFYIRRILTGKLENKLFSTLLIILAIDAFRTLFESVYFGLWYTSRVGFIPASIHHFLTRPENVFIPKSLNVVAAVLIILILLRRWIPEETEERIKEINYLKKLEKEINTRKQAQLEKEKLIKELQENLDQVKLLSGLLPICASCKKIRDDKGYWRQIELYIHDHSEADFSHGICPECAKKLYPEFADTLNDKKNSGNV